MRISQLEIRGFRGIANGMIVLPEHAVLLGANNAGKSTIVEALAILFGRDKMVSPICDWDFHGGSPKPDSRFYIIATITGFSSNDPTHIPDWFIGENVAQPVWWHEDAQAVSTEADPPEGTTLAARIAVAGRFDDEACEFETLPIVEARRSSVGESSSNHPPRNIPVAAMTIRSPPNTMFQHWKQVSQSLTSRSKACRKPFCLKMSVAESDVRMKSA
jgi:putative ATP-dependent endonuclease of OLD family